MKDTLTSFAKSVSQGFGDQILRPSDQPPDDVLVYCLVRELVSYIIIYNRHMTHMTYIYDLLSLTLFIKKIQRYMYTSNPINKNFTPRDLFQVSTAPPSETPLTSESDAGPRFFGKSRTPCIPYITIITIVLVHAFHGFP